MTIFKTFIKILNKNKFIIILYTVLLLLFGGFNMQTSDNNINFIAVKPDIVIVNKDEEKGITKNLINYLEKNANITEIEEEKIDDALFYRQIDYVIYINKDFNKEFMSGNDPEIEIKTTGNFESSYSEMMLNKYLETAKIYQKTTQNEEEIIKKIDETLNKQTKVEITTKLDTTSLEKASFYYTFASYSILACLVYVICLILSVFNNEKIKKKNIISGAKNKEINKILLISNIMYAIVLWLFYVIISFILIGKTMFTQNGILYILNSLIFTISSTSLAFLIGNIITKKEAISGIVNVVALGSSFLCGAFVPQQYLPSLVLKLAHILPTYYYINSNDKIQNIEIINLKNLMPIIINIGIMIIFTIIFIIITNIISKKKEKIG